MHKKSNKSKSDFWHVPTFKNTPKVFSGARFEVHTMLAEGKSGKPIQREVVVHPGAVVILPILDEEHIVMIRNERFAVGRELWELPAGTLEVNEPPLLSAKRELIEETGYEAKQVEPLVTFFTSPGICNEVMYAFVAQDLTFVGQNLDENEKIITEVVTWQKAMDMVRDGTIADGKTITTLLYYHSFCRK
jgi:ADP-ribose pyrophosphatase